MLKPGHRAWIAVTACVGIPAIVVLSVWAPVVLRYHVRPVDITAEVVQQARQAPADSVLSELKEFRFVQPVSSRTVYMNVGPSDTQEVVRVAEGLVRGTAAFPDYPNTRISLPFDSRDLENVPPAWRLPVAGLALPRALLDAYDVTGRDEFLAAARDMVVEFGEFERDAWLPRGLLWNDHAIAARIGVLTELWRLYRHHPRYEPAIGKAILQQVERHAELLAKPSLFTFATNHGVMQNLALLHVAVAFPMLPDAQRYGELALQRLRDQVPFYVDEDGVVLEHSAGYQRLGVELIAMACRYLTLLQQPIPEEWRRKYARAQNVLAALRRPDGSLPSFGDTDGVTDDLGPLIGALDGDRIGALHHAPRSIPGRSLNLYPGAGYAIWWDGLGHWPDPGDLRHTVVTWSYFPGHAHKNADEMSVLMWAGGQPWWTNVGYWPYTMAGRSDAESWAGANAPHLIGESPESSRNTILRSSGWSQRLAVVDLERSGPGNYRARRQVVHIKPDVWLVVDHVTGDDTLKTITAWTTASNVNLRKDTTPGSYILESRQRSLRLKTFVLSSPGATIREFQGSMSPFAGWHVVDGLPKPAPAFVIEQPARDAWSIVVWSLEAGLRDSPRAVALPRASWNGADDWTVEVPTRTGTYELVRDRNRIALSDGQHGVVETLDLGPAPDVSRQVATINTAFATVGQAYPRFDDQLRRRTKVTYLLLVVFLGQELFFWFMARKRPAYYLSLRVINLGGWIGVGCWLMLSFLKSP